MVIDSGLNHVCLLHLVCDLSCRSSWGQSEGLCGKKQASLEAPPPHITRFLSWQGSLKMREPIELNLEGLREYINSSNACIGICCIPHLLFREDQREARRAEIPFVDMRRVKKKKERCSHFTGCGDEIGIIWQFITTKQQSAASALPEVILQRTRA